MAFPDWYLRLANGDVADDDPHIVEQCIRVAQRLHQCGRQIIAFWPASERVAVGGLMLRLSQTLSELSRGSVALIDANVRYPAFPLFTTEARPPQANDEIFFAESWLTRSIAVLSPRFIGEAGAGIRQLSLIVERYRASFAYLLIDLTGFDRLGDHLGAAALADGVVIVARAGLSREPDLIRIRNELPVERNLGVVLTG